MIKSVYIHIPFCRRICSYCDFCKNYYDKKIVNNYLNALDNEIKNNYKNEVIKTIYIGGGTPSMLSIKELNKLFEIIKRFNLSRKIEFTIECNYEDITEEKLLLFKENKINRLSIGVQTFNNKYESYLNRKINKDEMIDKINLSKKYFENISIDLIYGLKNEKLDDLKNDLYTLIKLDIKHVSMYNLIIENNTMLKINKEKNIKEDLESKMYNLIYKTLKENNYNRYEVSNYCKKGFESKHNLTYWNNNNYYGFGLGASGFINDVRYTNTRSMKKYINGKIISYQEKLTYYCLLKDEVMLNLRKTKGINKKTFYNKYKKNLSDIIDLRSFKKNKLLIETKNNIYIPRKYFYVQNSIIVDILALIDVVKC